MNENEQKQPAWSMGEIIRNYQSTLKPVDEQAVQTVFGTFLEIERDSKTPGGRFVTSRGGKVTLAEILFGDNASDMGRLEHLFDSRRTKINETRILAENHISRTAELQSIEDLTFLKRSMKWMKRHGFRIHLVRIAHLDDKVSYGENYCSFQLEVVKKETDCRAVVSKVSGRRGFLVETSSLRGGNRKTQTCSTIVEVKKILKSSGYLDPSKSVSVDDII